MKSLTRLFFRAVLGGTAAWGVAPLVSAAGKHNPTSKFYVADVDGDAQIDTGSKIDDLTRQSVYNAEGTVVETKANASNAMVFSNGTGVFFDEDTRLEVKKFEQEPFVPNRTDMDVEPSISQTRNYVPRGTVGLCTSKLAAGSTMTYATPLGSVNITGGKLVVSSQNNSTVISMLDGQSTVNGGEVETGGQVLKSGQQAVITPSANGGPPTVTIQDIPSGDRAGLDQKATMACNAKKTVYFEVRNLGNVPNPDAIGPAGVAGNPGIGAFDGDSGASDANAGSTGQTTGTPQQQIVAVPVAPADTPVQFTQSAANLVTQPSGTP